MARVAPSERFRAELDEALAGVGQEQDPVETIGRLGARLILQQALEDGIAVAAFVHGYEEPVLAQRFGTQYEDYRRAVPAWWPRLTPWGPGSRNGTTRVAARGRGRDNRE
jgi:hypothetical protein